MTEESSRSPSHPSHRCRVTPHSLIIPPRLPFPSICINLGFPPLPLPGVRRNSQFEASRTRGGCGCEMVAFSRSFPPSFAELRHASRYARCAAVVRQRPANKGALIALAALATVRRGESRAHRPSKRGSPSRRPASSWTAGE